MFVCYNVIQLLVHVHSSNPFDTDRVVSCSGGEDMGRCVGAERSFIRSLIDIGSRLKHFTRDARHIQSNFYHLYYALLMLSHYDNLIWYVYNHNYHG